MANTGNQIPLNKPLAMYHIIQALKVMEVYAKINEIKLLADEAKLGMQAAEWLDNLFYQELMKDKLN